MKRQNRNTRTVLISAAQYEEIQRLQDAERSRSPVGACPTINALVRGLMAKALESTGNTSTGTKP